MKPWQWILLRSIDRLTQLTFHVKTSVSTILSRGYALSTRVHADGSCYGVEDADATLAANVRTTAHTEFLNALPSRLETSVSNMVPFGHTSGLRSGKRVRSALYPYGVEDADRMWWRNYTGLWCYPSEHPCAIDICRETTELPASRLNLLTAFSNFSSASKPSVNGYPRQILGMSSFFAIRG